MFSGSMVALVTPMQSDGCIDFAALSSLIEWHIESGTDAIVAVGTTGESATLNIEEHIEVIRVVVEKVNNRIPVIAGTGANSTAEAIYLAREALTVGADAHLSVVPYYNRPTQQGLIEHFTAIAEAVPLPMILYNVPCRTACDMLPRTVSKLVDLTNIVGIKEASGSIDRIKELAVLCEGRANVFSGDDDLACRMMIEAGARGVISVTANVAPDLMAKMAKAAISGDEQSAIEINAKLAKLHHSLFLESNPIPVKWAVARLGRSENGIRLPLTELSQKHHTQIDDAISEAGLSHV